MTTGSGPAVGETPSRPQDGRRATGSKSLPGESGEDVTDIGEIRRTEEMLEGLASRGNRVTTVGWAVARADPAVSVLAALVRDVEEHAGQRRGEHRHRKLPSGRAGMRGAAAAVVAAAALATSGVAAAGMHGRLPWLAKTFRQAAASAPQQQPGRGWSSGSDRSAASGSTRSTVPGLMPGADPVQRLRRPDTPANRLTLPKVPGSVRTDTPPFPGRVVAAGRGDRDQNGAGLPSRPGSSAGGPMRGPSHARPTGPAHVVGGGSSRPEPGLRASPEGPVGVAGATARRGAARVSSTARGGNESASAPDSIAAAARQPKARRPRRTQQPTKHPAGGTVTQSEHAAQAQQEPHGQRSGSPLLPSLPPLLP